MSQPFTPFEPCQHGKIPDVIVHFTQKNWMENATNFVPFLFVYFLIRCCLVVQNLHDHRKKSTIARFSGIMTRS